MGVPGIEFICERIKVGDGCWEWAGGRTAKGYGSISCYEKGRWWTVGAHRRTYELLVGAIPPGLELDHLCRNRACVRPSHLEAVTHAENIRRGVEARDRLAPATPPPLARGQRIARSGEGSTCGYEGTYQRGCRCDMCRAAHTRYARRRRDLKAAV